MMNYPCSLPKIIENISDDMYVKDLTYRGSTVGEVEIFKQKCVKSYLKKVASIYTSSILTRHYSKIIKQLPQMSLLIQSKYFKPVEMKLKY